MAGGAVIEILSTRKLIFLFVILLVIQVVFFLIGGLIAPKPSDAVEQPMINCVDDGNSNFFLPHHCQSVNLESSEAQHYRPGDIVFSASIPKNPHNMSPWFQYLLTLLTLTIPFKKNHQPVNGAKMLLDVKIMYSDVDDWNVRLKEPKAWKPLSQCSEERIVECVFDHPISIDSEGYHHNCEILHLFQLGSVFHKAYLVNIRLPINTTLDPDDETIPNTQIGPITEMAVVLLEIFCEEGNVSGLTEKSHIRQNGGFTKVWVSLKSVMTAVMIIPIIWFWRRIMMLDRKPMLIEKAIFSLGISMLFLNLPLELISIFFEAPWMLFFIDVRQGLFYAVLLSFWIIFIGEHLMDQPKRNKLSAYRCHLALVFSSMLSLLAFDIAERGMQLVNPCTTVWSHPNIAIALIITASIGGCLYFLVLCYKVIKVLRAISYKGRFVLTDNRRAHSFRAVVSRFRVLMLLSVGTAALTVTFYVLSQKYDGLLQFGDHKIVVSSAFFTGVYGLWNIYVFLVLSVYAPSHKKFDMDDDNDANGSQELIALRSTDQSQIFQLTQQKEQED